MPNIEYEFNLWTLDGDKNVGDTLSVDKPTVPPTLPNGYIDRDWYNYKSPYISDHLLAYQRDEVYRFCITFFDKRYRPSFAKWIADIRMPAM